MSRRELAVLARAVAYNAVVPRLRSPFDTATTLLAAYALFAVLLVGGRAVAPELVADSLPGIIVGVSLLLMATVAYSELSWKLVREAQWGTLEQLFMSPLGFGRVVLLKTGVSVLVAFAYGAVLLVSMMATTGEWLALDPLTVVPVGLLSLGSAVGVGFLLGGLALLFERVEGTFQVVGLAFVAFVAAPVDQVPLLKLLPLSLGSALLRTAMGEGVGLLGLPRADLALLVVKCAAYVAAGYAVFGYAGRVARRTGRLGQY